MNRSCVTIVARAVVVWQLVVAYGTIGCSRRVDGPVPVATKSPSDSSLNYCRAIAKAESEVSLAGVVLSTDEFGRRCQDLAIRINNINTSKVDSRFVDWTSGYTTLLLEMHECCSIIAQRRTSNYQARRLIESFVRGADGDPFGVAIEEMSAADQEARVMKTFESRRLKFLFELQRQFNAIAPEGQRVAIEK